MNTHPQPATEPTAIEPEVRARQVGLLYHHARTSIPISLVNALIYVAVMWKASPHAYLLTWFGLLFISGMARLKLAYSYHRNPPDTHEIKPWFDKFVIGTAISGVIWGSAGIIFMPPGQPLYQSVTILLLSGTAAGATSTFSSILLAYRVFLFPLLLPLIAHLFYMGDEIHFALALLVILFLFMLSQRAGVTTYNTISESLSFGLKNEILVNQLESAIGQYKTTQEELAELNNFSETIIAETESGIMVHQPTGECLLANKAAASIIGATPEEALRHNFRTSSSWQEHGLIEIADNILNSGIPKAFEVEMRTIFGKEVWLFIQMSRIKRGNHEMLLSVFNDISVYRRAELAMQEAKEAAELATRTKSQFLANMSHEIRTPINAVIGLSQLAHDETSISTIRSFLGKINSSATSLLEIINDLLDFSKIEAGKLALEKEPFELGKMLDDVWVIMEVSAGKKGLHLAKSVDPNIPQNLVGDSLRLRQVFINLISNAIKFTESGSVTVRVNCLAKSDTEARIECAVQDTGIGISSQQQAILFQPFTQGDGSTTRKYGGTGLGLAICKELVHQMGGDIRIVSTLGAGSNFIFTVTLESAPAVATSTRDESEAQNNGSPPQDLTGMRVLLAEDNAINQLLAKTLLNRAGVDVVLASNGEEAVYLLTHGADEFDAVLMDIQMPVMDGLEATTLIRNQLGLTDIPIIALTAHALEEEKQRCMDAGMNAHAIKPINAQELLSVLGQFYTPK